MCEWILSTARDELSLTEIAETPPAKALFFITQSAEATKGTLAEYAAIFEEAERCARCGMPPTAIDLAYKQFLASYLQSARGPEGWSSIAAALIPCQSSSGEAEKHLYYHLDRPRP